MKTEVFLKILFFALIIDLSGKLGIRDILLAFSIPILFIKSNKSFKTSELAIYLLILVLYPTFLLLKSNYNNELIFKTQYFATIQIFIIYLVLRNYKNDFLINNFLHVIKYIQPIVIFLFLGALLDINIFNVILLKLGEPFDGGYFGYLRIGDFKYPQIYLKSTLIFVFPAIYFFTKKDFKNSFLSITILLISLSKSGFILSLLGVFMYSLRNLHFKRILLLFTIVIILFLTFGWYFDMLISLPETYTAQKRISQFEWFIRYITNDPFTFLIGQGFGHFSTISGVEDFAIELDHLDAIRKYGFIWFSLISIPLVKSIVKIRKSKYSYPYIFTYIAVGTNPLLITNLFFIITLIFIKSFNEQNSINYSNLER